MSTESEHAVFNQAQANLNHMDNREAVVIQGEKGYAMGIMKPSPQATNHMDKTRVALAKYKGYAMGIMKPSPQANHMDKTRVALVILGEKGYGMGMHLNAPWNDGTESE